MPSKSTLCRALQKSNIAPGFTDSLFSAVKMKSKCNVRTTKYVANHALAFMVHGLASKWKQPVCYFLTSGTVIPVVLKTLVRNCISKLADIGLNIRVIVCDQGSNNRSMIKSLNVTPESPFNDGNNIFLCFI